MNEEEIPFDSSKLTGRIIEKFGTREKFAIAIGAKCPAVSKRLNNTIDMTRTEILKWAEVLEIQKDEIASYFFKV